MGEPLDDEQLLGATAILLHQLGDVEAASLLADVTTLETMLWNTSSFIGQNTYRAILRVEPHLRPLFAEEVLERVQGAMSEALGDAGYVETIEARPVIPVVGPDWRKQLRAATGPQPSNQARRVRLEPQHPIEDGVHFTNEWEHKVYVVLKERQAILPDNETIGIMPLGAMRLLGSTREPDFLITYKGRAGVIEVDGPHHEGVRRASSDHSRDNLMLNAGVEWVGRLDVRDVKTKAEVEKFVDNFLARLARR